MSSSSSDASQSQLQESQDNRISAATDSVNLVSSRSTIGNINISQTDHGAVKGALEFGSDALGQSYDFAAQISKNAANETAASGARSTAVAQSAMDSVKSAYADTSATLADAYETAKAGEQKIMVAAGLAIVGLVAIKSFGR